MQWIYSYCRNFPWEKGKKKTIKINHRWAIYIYFSYQAFWCECECIFTFIFKNTYNT